MTHPRDACPDCGASKGVDADRCRRCAGRLRRTAEHGTDSRYARHRRDGETPCEACRRAHTEDEARRQRRRVEQRQRERAASRKAKRTCPQCGGVKSTAAKVCRECVDHTVRHRRLAEHGTDSGYYKHVRQSRPSDDWPRTPCDACRAAHSEANRERAQGKPRRKRSPQPRTPSRRVCRDCGTSVSERAQRCRRCARLHHIEQTTELPVRWRRVGLIWKAA